MTSFTVNGTQVESDSAPETPLLWVLREHLKLTGTKFGCGKGLCGACTAMGLYPTFWTWEQGPFLAR